MELILLMAVLMLGGGAAWLTEAWDEALPRRVAMGTLAVAAVLTYMLWQGSDQSIALGTGTSDWRLLISHEWIPRFGISFLFGLDGISLIMVSLTIILGVVAVVSSWHEIEKATGFFHFNLLWTLAGVVGVFTALDLFLFFFFWEVMLIPMYLLIAIWGHEARSYASMKFFLFTQISGLLMLVSIVALVFVSHEVTGVWTFSYFDLVETVLPPDIAYWLMLGFFIAFVVKLPGFPFHTWLPDAHTQAPTAASVLLAGILLKTGGYGLIRFTLPLFPEASQQIAPLAMALGAAGILYGAVLAFAQVDFKRLVAYSSVSHMGFVLIGVYAWNELALQGAMMQMIAHGFSTAALFMIAGALQHRLHTRDMMAMGGLWRDMPRMGAIAMFFIIASLGVPGLGNFVGEFLVLAGVFRVEITIAVIATIGLVAGAAYALIAMQRVFQGPRPDNAAAVADFGVLEVGVLFLMMVALTGIGIYPQPLLDVLEPVLASIYQLSNTDVAWIGRLP